MDNYKGWSKPSECESCKGAAAYYVPRSNIGLCENCGGAYAWAHDGYDDVIDDTDKMRRIDNWPSPHGNDDEKREIE